VRVSACYNDSFLIITYCNFSATSDADGRYELDVNARNYFILAVASLAHIDQVYRTPRAWVLRAHRTSKI